MLQTDGSIVRVASDGRVPDIDIFTDAAIGFAISVEGVAVPEHRNKTARGVREILQKTLSLFSFEAPKTVVKNAISLLRREVAEHLGNHEKPTSAHTAVIKFAWDDIHERVVALGDSEGGFKNFGFRNGKLGLLTDEAWVRPGDIFLQCSPHVVSNLDWQVIQEILNFKNTQGLSLEDIRRLLIEGAYNTIEKYRHTPLYEPRDMSVVLLEFDPIREARENDDRVTYSGRSASGPSFEKPSVLAFDFSDLLLPEQATQQEALLTLQKVRTRLVSLGYEGRVKPHHYADLPKRGDLQKVVKRAHDILEAEELRAYLKTK